MLYTSSGSPQAATHLPLKGKALFPPLLRVVKINRQGKNFASCLPLEGKVSAKPTDEVSFKVTARIFS